MTSISIFIIYDKTNTDDFKFLSLGDGLSKGLNPSGIKSYDYNEYIEEFMKKKDKKVSYYNYSTRDISIAELNNEIIYLKDKILKEYLQTSNIIILSIGEKEIKDGKSIKEIEENLTNLINEIKRYNSNICLLGHFYLNNEKDNLIAEMNNIYKKIAKNNNIIYINIENAIYSLPSSNNLYPTIRGYKEIGKLIISAIEKNK